MRILAVFAHPDDEAFGPAGTLSRYSLTGHEVRLVTLTCGEAGTLGPASKLSRLELGWLRSDELRCSAKAMNLSALNIYQLPDGKLSELPAEQGLAIIRGEIDSFLPDAVMTFHDAGISGHTDHRTAARWCLQAVQERSNGIRLLAYGLSEEQVKRITHRKLVPIPEHEITHVIDVSQYLEHKFRAIRCHHSQSESWERMQAVEGGIESFLRNEHFSQVWPAPEPCARSARLED
jgi:LmbE family N-acetylglucosaminyl deacetylase